MTERSWFWSGTTIGDAALPAPYGAPYSDDMFSDVLRSAFQFDRTRSGVVLTVNPPFDTNLSAALNNTGIATAVSVSPGRAFVDGKLYESDATITFNFAAEGWYQVVLRKDFAAQTIRMIFRQGQTVTQLDGVIWEIELFRIEHRPNNGTGSFTDLLDHRVFIASQTGAIIQLHEWVSWEDASSGTPIIGNPPVFDFTPYVAGQVFSEYIIEMEGMNGVNLQAQQEMWSADYTYLEMILNGDTFDTNNFSSMTWDTYGDTTYNNQSFQNFPTLPVGLLAGTYFNSSHKITIQGVNGGPKTVFFEFVLAPSLQGSELNGKRPYVGRGGGVFGNADDEINTISFESGIGNRSFLYGRIKIYGRV